MSLELGITLQTWQDEAACRFAPLEVREEFISERYEEGEPSRITQRAFDTCALNCPVAEKCRQWADVMEKRTTSEHSLVGIYAAETPRMRAMRRRRENREIKERMKARQEQGKLRKTSK